MHLEWQPGCRRMDTWFGQRPTDVVCLPFTMNSWVQWPRRFWRIDSGTICHKGPCRALGGSEVKMHLPKSHCFMTMPYFFHLFPYFCGKWKKIAVESRILTSWKGNLNFHDCCQGNCSNLISFANKSFETLKIATWWRWNFPGTWNLGEQTPRSAPRHVQATSTTPAGVPWLSRMSLRVSWMYGHYPEQGATECKHQYGNTKKIKNAAQSRSMPGRAIVLHIRASSPIVLITGNFISNMLINVLSMHPWRPFTYPPIYLSTRPFIESYTHTYPLTDLPSHLPGYVWPPTWSHLIGCVHIYLYHPVSFYSKPIRPSTQLSIHTCPSQFVSASILYTHSYQVLYLQLNHVSI